MRRVALREELAPGGAAAPATSAHLVVRAQAVAPAIQARAATRHSRFALPTRVVAELAEVQAPMGAAAPEEVEATQASAGALAPVPQLVRAGPVEAVREEARAPRTPGAQPARRAQLGLRVPMLARHVRRRASRRSWYRRRPTAVARPPCVLPVERGPLPACSARRDATAERRATPSAGHVWSGQVRHASPSRNATCHRGVSIGTPRALDASGRSTPHTIPTVAERQTTGMLNRRHSPDLRDWLRRCSRKNRATAAKQCSRSKH